MNQAQLLEKLHSLPLEKQREVFDFIEFLVARSATQARTKPCLAEWLMMMPDAGLDADFARVDESEKADDVFN